MKHKKELSGMFFFLSGLFLSPSLWSAETEETGINKQQKNIYEKDQKSSSDQVLLHPEDVLLWFNNDKKKTRTIEQSHSTSVPYKEMLVLESEEKSQDSIGQYQDPYNQHNQYKEGINTYPDPLSEQTVETPIGLPIVKKVSDFSNNQTASDEKPKLPETEEVTTDSEGPLKSFVQNQEAGGMAPLASVSVPLPLAEPAVQIGAYFSDYPIHFKIVGKEPKTLYAFRGSYYIVGEPQERFSIQFFNRNTKRYLSVVSVDGLNVIDQKEAKTNGPGFIVPEKGVLHIGGWQTGSMIEKPFYFFEKIELQEDRFMGGVIGVAFFEENDKMFDNTDSPPLDLSMVLKNQGTYFAKQKFIKQDYRPTFVQNVFYDTYENLVKKGIIIENRKPFLD